MPNVLIRITIISYEETDQVFIFLTRKTRKRKKNNKNRQQHTFLRTYITYIKYLNTVEIHYLQVSRHLFFFHFIYSFIDLLLQFYSFKLFFLQIEISIYLIFYHS